MASLAPPDDLAAMKRALAGALRRKLAADGVSISEFAQRIGTGRTAVRRILDDRNMSITLQTMNRAAHALGYRLVLTARPLTPGELGTLAKAMVNARSEGTARRLKARIVRGFYGDAADPARERTKPAARASA